MSPLKTVLFSLCLCACICNASVAQEEEPPPVPTVWDKLGVTNAIKKAKEKRDARINKDGCSPEKEKKPQLVKISDKKNLESDNPLLAIAAKAKQDQDLIPQKLKALRYLSTLGCGCNADVEPAILAAMEDCAPAIRREAVRLVISAVNKTDICDTCEDGQKRKLFKKRLLCGHCKGKGCLSCKHQGSVEVDYASTMCECECTTCNVCGTCCSEAIQAKLQKMAYGQDSSGCYLEPDASIRALAEQALNLCPPAPIAFDDPDPVPPAKPVGPRPIFINPEGAPGSDAVEGNQSSWNSRRSDTTANYQLTSARNGLGNSAHRLTDEYVPIDQSNLVKATITQQAAGGMTLRFDDTYLFPQGARVYVTTGTGAEQIATIQQSDVARVEIQTDRQLGPAIPTGTVVWVGVLAD